MSKHTATPSAIRHIPAGALAVSEPNPAMFGNPDNDDHDPTVKWTNENWLKSRFHFSFAEYHNSRNSNFGVLRVMNDDLVQPERGFGTHGHRDMEICTYIVHGALTHKDSTGTEETLGRGAVQYMSAGTGVRHSESNNDPTNDLRFIQMWIVPRKHGLAPRYGGFRSADARDIKDTFYHLVSDDMNKNTTAPVKISQDVNIYVAVISAGRSVIFPLYGKRQAYGLIVEGHDVGVRAKNAINGTPSNSMDLEPSGAHFLADMHDGMELYGGSDGTEITFTASAKEPAHVLLVEMAQDGNGGRTDL